MMSHWKHFIIGPSEDRATRFYAPDLTTAIRAARGFFGMDKLRCYGASCSTGSSSPTAASTAQGALAWDSE